MTRLEIGMAVIAVGLTIQVALLVAGIKLTKGKTE